MLRKNGVFANNISKLNTLKILCRRLHVPNKALIHLVERVAHVTECDRALDAENLRKQAFSQVCREKAHI